MERNSKLLPVDDHRLRNRVAMAAAVRALNDKRIARRELPQEPEVRVAVR
jgi:hypothetical protein